MTLATECHVNSLVPQPLACEPVADTNLVHQIDGALLEHACADAFDHMLFAAIFDDE